MIYLNLLIGFLRVGCFSFGGAYSAIPLIRDVVHAYGWMTDEALSYMIAVSESTPGPIMVNLATYVGSSQAGIPGALVATTAVVLPAFLIILLVMAVLKTVLKNRYVQAVMNGLKPCIVGIILSTGAFMTFNSIVTREESLTFDLRAVAIAAFLAVLLFGSKALLKKKIPPILLIVISAVCGIAAYGIG